MADRLAELERRRAAALAMGGPERVERHHASGRLTARERLDALVDPGSFFEIGLLAEPEHRREKPAPADAIVAGLARIDGRKVCVLAVDATVLAGTTGQVNMRKQNRIALWAGQRGLPLICLSDNDGGRIPDVMGWRFSGLPFDFRTFVQAPEGRPEVPRLIAVVGASFGDSALHAAMGHFVVMTKDSAIALSGPPVIAAAIGEELTSRRARRPEGLQRAERQRPPRRRRRAGGARGDPARAHLPAGLRRPPRAGGACRAARAGRRGAAHARAERPAARLRHAQGARGDLRRGQHPAVGREVRRQRALLPGADRGRGGRGRREPADAAGRRDGRTGADEGSHVHRPLRHLQPPTRLPAGRSRA